MMPTLKKQDSGHDVVAAKLLTGYLKISKKVSDANVYIEKNKVFDADFATYIISWQNNHGTTADGVIGPDTWKAIANSLPACSTSKNRISGYTLALQILMYGNIDYDGVYGPRTKAAVAAYQDAVGLKSDGVCGPKTWNAMLIGVQPKPEPTPKPGKFVKPKDYKQASKPWGPKMYSNHGDKNQTMANSGCGPTAMSDIVYTLKDNGVTPWTIAQLSMKWGDRSNNNGTNWTLFKPHCAEHYKFVKVVKTATLANMKACLDAGGYVVCSMGPGYWTSGGHFITAWKYTDTDIYCNDPASSKRTHQKTSQFMKERKQFFCFYPDVKSGIDNDVPEVPIAIPPEDVKRGSRICDISHHQPTVNYDKFIADTALIILRPGYRGTGGSVKQDTCFVQHADALKARGVRFGTYFYSIADTEEKAREEARMYYKWAKDYDPLFWAMDAEKDSITKKAIVAFVNELRKLGAKKVGCYVANHLYEKYDYASIRDKMDFTWIPRYGSTPPKYKCDLWQYTSTGSVSGISGNVDLNKITGDGHDLAWFTDCGTENQPYNR